MGAWGVGALENDKALDWLVEFSRAPSVQALSATLSEGFSGARHEHESTGIESLAAAEIVVCLFDRSREPPDEVAGWIAGEPTPDRGLARLAHEAVEAIHAGSALRDLWSGPDLEEWLDDTAGLLRVLEPHR
jgi:hypothetical protein